MNQQRYEKSEPGDPEKWRTWLVLRGMPLAERLEKYTHIGDPHECWLWSGAASSGYGRITGPAPERKKLLAHRVAYEVAKGPIPEGMVIDHLCHVPLCVNPSHLRAVTVGQNGEHRAGATVKSKSGYLGVYEYYPGCWRGKVKQHGKEHFTPRCNTPEEADVAVRALRNELFTHNDRDRRVS